MSRARGTQDDLADKMVKTLAWIEIRLRLSALLQHQADHGDEKAGALLTFVAKEWPAGGVPRQLEGAHLEQTIHNLRDLLGRVLSLGAKELPPHMLDEAALLGCEVRRD